MATVSHTFVSAVTDGADTTLVQPSNWNANHTVTLGVGDEVVAGLSSDATVNNTTTLVKITGLDITLGVGSWHFRYLIRYQVDVTTTGVKFAVNHSGTVTAFVANHSFAQALSTAATLAPDQDTSGAAVGLAAQMAVRANNVTAGPTSSSDTINADMLWVVEGLLVVTVSGSLQLFHASEVAANSTVKTGSGVVACRVV